MVEAVIRALIYLCALAIVFYLVIWVLGELGIALPIMVVHIIGIMLVLVAFLILWRLFSPWFAGANWWGRGPGQAP